MLLFNRLFWKKVFSYELIKCFNISIKINSCQKILSNFSCPKDYYRLNENDSCIQCKANFSSSTEYPFNCYLVHKSLNFNQAKYFCARMNSSLWTPKSISEINLFPVAWVNSEVSYVGEPYVWPDGSKVKYFSNNEPNNHGGNNWFLRENALEFNGKIFDINGNATRPTVCQQNT